MNYAKAFKEIREEAGLTRPELAKELGVTPTALWKIENSRTTPKEKTIMALCNLVHIPPAYFYNLAAVSTDYGTPLQRNTLSRLSEAIGQLKAYQNFAQSGWIHEILYDLHIVQAELEGKEHPNQEDLRFNSWRGFDQTE